MKCLKGRDGSLCGQSEGRQLWAWASQLGSHSPVKENSGLAREVMVPPCVAQGSQTRPSSCQPGVFGIGKIQQNQRETKRENGMISKPGE